MKTNNLLELKNVSKIYPMDGVEIKALNNVSLTVYRGEMTAVMGPSGSGKSTLMHLAGCLDTPSSGQVIFQNQDISQLNETQLAHIRNQKIGFVFQSFNLIPRTSAINNVMLPLYYRGLEETQRRQKAYQVLKKVGLQDRTEHRPNQLSGGEQQRVAIARALVNQPVIIMADEPTGNLDTKTGHEIMEMLIELNRQGNTIVVVTHEEEIAQMTKRIIKIRDGQIIDAG